MSTKIRPEISKKNPYWISKHRYYELLHFCLQYNEWKKKIETLQGMMLSAKPISQEPHSTDIYDPTPRFALRIVYFNDKIERVKNAAEAADDAISSYILQSVTEGRSYRLLREIDGMPCSKEYFYDRYRRFFYILDHYDEFEFIHDTGDD